MADNIYYRNSKKKLKLCGNKRVILMDWKLWVTIAVLTLLLVWGNSHFPKLWGWDGDIK